MKKKALVCAALAAVLALSGCAKKSESISGSAANKSVAPTQDMAIKSEGQNANAKMADSTKLTNTSTAVQTEMKIIRNGTLYIVEEDLSKLSVSLKNKAIELGGYIENENLMETRLATKIRIPSNKFDDFMSFTEKGFDVKNKSITSDNITDAYVDNEARLKNLRAQEEQILTILKKANTVEEVLKVQGELYRIRGEAEALEARKKSWDKQVDYATVTVNADKKMIVPDSKKSIISGSEFGKAVGKGFSNTTVSLVLAIENILIFIFSNIIVLLILGVAGFFGFRSYRKKYRK